MAECTTKDLRAAREARNMRRWQLGEAVGVSEDTVERWETGKSTPTPDDVDRIGEAVNDPTLWHRWMISNCDSYRKRYQGIQSYELLASVIRTGFHLEDMARLQRAIERDVVDGVIDDPKAKSNYRDQLMVLQACITDTLQKVK